MSMRSKESQAWSNMKSRCINENHKDYHNYGGRGIMICARWLESSYNFLSDVGEAPSKQHTLERIDNNGNYEPDNVRWATKTEQACNKRNTILITYLCRTRILGEWCRILNLKYSSLWKVIRLSKHVNHNEVFAAFLTSKIERERKSVPQRKDSKRRYYHDLHSVLEKYGLA